MYNTYQNRVATARESYNNAVLNYNNAIKDARLQNNSALAEIAYNALQQQLELSLQGFQYKNNLLLEKANKKTELENTYYNRYLDVLDQINKENTLAEEIRQYNEQMALEREKFEWQQAQATAKSSGGGGGGSGRSGGGSGGGSGRSGGGSGTIPKTQKSGDLPEETAKSVLDLGGPYSAEYVADQVAKGKVIQTTSSSGNTVFKKNTAFNNAVNTTTNFAKPAPKEEEKTWRNLWGLLD
jgi:hypothetical protein